MYPARSFGPCIRASMRHVHAILSDSKTYSWERRLQFSRRWFSNGGTRDERGGKCGKTVTFIMKLGRQNSARWIRKENGLSIRIKCCNVQCLSPLAVKKNAKCLAARETRWFHYIKFVWNINPPFTVINNPRIVKMRS